MRIAIIGPSGAGKTTLARTLATEKNLPLFSLDQLLYRQIASKRREAIPPDEWNRTLENICRGDDWIIEGVNALPHVLELADQIIYVRPRLITALWRQWKRFFTDATQRKEHGFVNNLKLSKYLVRQYLEETDPKKWRDPMYTRVSKLDTLAKHFANKVEIRAS